MQNNLLIDKLRSVEARYEDLNQQLALPEVVSDSKRYQKTAKAHSDLSEIVSKFREYKDLERGIAQRESGAVRRPARAVDAPVLDHGAVARSASDGRAGLSLIHI